MGAQAVGGETATATAPTAAAVSVSTVSSVDEALELAKAGLSPSHSERAKVGAYLTSLCVAGNPWAGGAGGGVAGKRRRAPGQHRRGPPRAPPGEAKSSGGAAEGAVDASAAGSSPRTPAPATTASAAAEEFAMRVVAGCIGRGAYSETALASALEWVLCAGCGGDPAPVLAAIEAKCGSGGACGAEWGRNDVAYRCRTCEKDPTCAICVQCFLAGDHEGHDYMMIRTSGGCCDCGDVDAWESSGFCKKHQLPSSQQELPQPLGELLPGALRGIMKLWACKLLEAATAAKSGAAADEQFHEYVDEDETSDSDEDPFEGNLEDDEDTDDGMEDLDVVGAAAGAGLLAGEPQMAIDAGGNGGDGDGGGGDDDSEEAADDTGSDSEGIDGSDDEAGTELRQLFEQQGLMLPSRRAPSAVEKTVQVISATLAKWLLGLCGRGTALLSAVADAVSEKTIRIPAQKDTKDGKDHKEVSILHVFLGVSTAAPAGVTGAVRPLLYKLMADSKFKRSFAHALVDHYPEHMAAASADVHSLRSSLSANLLDAFSVQVFTVFSLVEELVRDRGLLEMLLETTLSVLRRGTTAQGLDLESAAVEKRLYSRVVEDLRYVLMAPAVNELAASTPSVLVRWMGVIASVQGIDEHTRKLGAHVEMESDAWIAAFLLETHVSHISPLLLQGAKRAQKEEQALLSSTLVAHLLRWLAHTATHKALTSASVVAARLKRMRKQLTGQQGGQPPMHEAWNNSNADAGGVDAPSQLELLHALVMTYAPGEALSLDPGAVQSFTNVDGRLHGTAPVHRCVWDLFAKHPASAEEPMRTLVNAARVLLADGGGPSGANETGGGSGGAVRTATAAPGDGGQVLSGASSGGDIGVGKDITSFIDSLISRAAALAKTAVGAPPEPWESTVASNAVLAAATYDPAAIVRLNAACEVVQAPRPITFNLPLHRFLAEVFKQALRDGGTGPARALLPTPFCDDPSQAAALGCAIAQHPLELLGVIAEQRAGMWRRNGFSFAQLVELYYSAQWCEGALELDLALLQVSACLQAVDSEGAGVDAGALVRGAARAFGLGGMLEGRAPSVEGSNVLAQNLVELLLVLGKERRTTIGYPSPKGECARTALRREIIQRLAAGDATHSQVQAYLPQAKSDEMSNIELVEEVLAEVADFVEPQGLKQGHFKLKKDSWKHYDMHHPRCHQRDFQKAVERYAAATGGGVIVADLLPKWSEPPAPCAHLAEMVCCEDVLTLIGASMVGASAAVKDATAASGRPGVLPLEEAAVTALHLLCLAGRAAQWRGGELVSVLSSRLGDRRKWYGPSTSARVASDQERTESCWCLSVFDMLATLATSEGETGMCAKAVLASLNDSLGTDVQAGRAGTQGEPSGVQEGGPPGASPAAEDAPSPQDDAEARRALMKAKQEAAMAAMRQQQEFFLTQMEGMDTSSDDEMDEGDAAAKDAAAAAADEGASAAAEGCVQGAAGACKKSDKDEGSHPVCLLCRGSAATPLCRLALAQRSSVALHAGLPPPVWSRSAGSDDEATQGSAGESSAPIGALPYAHSGEFVSLRKRDLALPDRGQLNIHTTCLRGVRARKRAVAAAMDTPHSHFGAAMSHGAAGSGMASPATIVGDHRPESNVEITSMHVGGCVVMSCGHTFHSGCLESYCSSLLSSTPAAAAAADGMEMGEFPCPVCRRLSNCSLPVAFGDNAQNEPRATVPEAPPAVNASDLDEVLSGFADARQRHAEAVEEASTKVAQHVAALKRADSSEVTEDLSQFPPMLARRRGDLVDSLASRLCCLGNADAQLEPAAAAGISEMVGHGDERATLALKLSLENSIVALEVESRQGDGSKARGTTETDADSNSARAALAALAESAHRQEEVLRVLYRAAATHRKGSELARCLREVSLCGGFEELSGEHTMHPLVQASINVLNEVANFLGPNPRGKDPISSKFGTARDALLLARGSLLLSQSDSNKDALAKDPFAVLCRMAPDLSNAGGERRLAFASAYVVAVVQALADDLAVKPSGADRLVALLASPPDGGSAREEEIAAGVTRRSLVFLRRAAVLKSVLEDAPLSAVLEWAPLLELQSTGGDANEVLSLWLCRHLGLPHPREMLRSFWAGRTLALPLLDAVVRKHTPGGLARRHAQQRIKLAGPMRYIAPAPEARPLKLIELPRSYEVLFPEYLKAPCSICGQVPTSPALCLLCGTLVCNNSQSCSKRGRRGCARHSLACGGGVGAFLLLRDTRTLLLRAERRCVWGSLYLDQYGEEDPSRRRGRALYLSQERVAQLTNLLAGHRLEDDLVISSRTVRDGRLH